jgi:Domain of unknown function (DUF4411)
MAASPPPAVYLIDTNALIDFGERYYADDVFGGLWKLLSHGFNAGTLLVSKGVMDEIRASAPMPLWRKALDNACKGKLIDESAHDIQLIFGRLARDIASKKVLSELSETDQLILACGEARSYMIVSSDGGVRNTCRGGHIKAQVLRPIEFLRAVGWRFP